MANAFSGASVQVSRCTRLDGGPSGRIPRQRQDAAGEPSGRQSRKSGGRPSGDIRRPRQIRGPAGAAGVRQPEAEVRRARSPARRLRWFRVLLSLPLPASISSLFFLLIHSRDVEVSANVNVRSIGQELLRFLPCLDTRSAVRLRVPAFAHANWRCKAPGKPYTTCSIKCLERPGEMVTVPSKCTNDRNGLNIGRRRFKQRRLLSCYRSDRRQNAAGLAQLSPLSFCP
jgi:hypothetical protein